MRELKLGTSWVRGIVGEALYPELIICFARAFGTWVEGATVAVGRDTRQSSEMVHAAVVAGLLASDCRIVDLGTTSTPLISFAVRELGCGGGISITGSHNDARWNALKFVGPDGSLLNDLKSEELLDIYHASAFRAPTDHPRPPEPGPDDLTSEYVSFLCSLLDEALIRARQFRVAIDLRGGGLGPLVQGLGRRLGWKVILINDSSQGPSQRPEPTARSMDQLAQAVQQHGCDIGFALNIDGDRLGIVTEQGKPLSEEMTLPIVAMNRLQRRPGVIVTSLSTSSRVGMVAERFSQKIIRTAVGESHVIDRGLEDAAVLAGEGSGGVAVLPASVCFDGLASMGQILELVSSRNVQVSELAESIPQPHMRKGEIRCPAPQAYRVLERFRDRFEREEVDTVDGVRVEWEDLWVHVRVSNTEPVLRIIAEGPASDRVDALFSDCMGFARQFLAEEDS